MAIKKSELYSSIWKSCDELRGGMDASQYKDYVLVLLFVKYVSDKYAGARVPLIHVPLGGSFQDIVALKGSKEIGDQINIIIKRLAEANELKGVIDVADFNDEDKLGKGKEMQDRLSNLVAIFENPALNFGKNRADGDDILGDAYEYLMRNFATQSGKSKGQFYTPAEVSRIMAKVIGIDQSTSQTQTIYDPTCGSGSLLIKAADEAPRSVTIYGQEMDNATRALAKMNMILHGHPTADIWRDNTLANPYFRNPNGSLKTFDFAVANPPFSYKAWSNGFDPVHDEFDRFTGFGIPPAKNGDYAFLLHLVRSLKSTGKGAIILPHGVLFRGNAEGNIRENLVRRGYIKGIIALPPNLFYGTSIAACIIVIDKENAAGRRGIFMVDASKGYIKDGNKNRLREQDIHKIVDVFNKQLALPNYSRLVSFQEIEANDFNLNIPRYIDTQEAEDIQDIEAHLLGGIPDRDIAALDNYWAVYPTLRSELFVMERPGYHQLATPPDKIKESINTHAEFVAYAQEVAALFRCWRDHHTPMLKAIQSSDSPKEIIHTLSEDSLQTFSGRNLLDKYDIYQHLMLYWQETMKDDVYMIVEDGWQADIYTISKGRKKEWACDLIPKELVIRRYFSAEQAAIEQLKADQEAISHQLAELEAEHSGEEGLLEACKSDAGNITKTSVQARVVELKEEIIGSSLYSTELKEIARTIVKDFAKVNAWPKGIDDDAFRELDVLWDYLTLYEAEKQAKEQTTAAEEALDKMLLEKYQALTADEIKTLVVDDKWMSTLQGTLQSEMDRISHRLSSHIQKLAERYAYPLPRLVCKAEGLKGKVDTHLQNMGFEW